MCERGGGVGTRCKDADDDEDASCVPDVVSVNCKVCSPRCLLRCNNHERHLDQAPKRCDSIQELLSLQSNLCQYLIPSYSLGIFAHNLPPDS